MYVKIKKTDILDGKVDLKLGALALIKDLKLNKNDMIKDKTFYFEKDEYFYIKIALFDLKNKNRKYPPSPAEKARLTKYIKDNGFTKISDEEVDKLHEFKKEIKKDEANNFDELFKIEL